MIYVATTNLHKLEEIQAILGAAIRISKIPDDISDEPVEETAMTFEGNARLKAEAFSRHLSGWVLADDSGLEVDVLDGAPGVHSARYAGAGATDAENRKKLLEALRVFREPQTARFRCVVAVAHQGKTVRVFEGRCEGRVILEERGLRGFGYDALFIPARYAQTFGELSSDEKNMLSHRYLAIKEFAHWFEENVKTPTS